MTVTLIFWIAGCIGESCPIPYYETLEFSDMLACEKTLQTWNGISPNNLGVCLEGDDWRPDEG